MQRLSGTFDAAVVAARPRSCFDKACRHHHAGPDPLLDEPTGPTCVGCRWCQLRAERHRPLTKPYPGARGFVLACCPTCDGVRWTVRVEGEPYSCEVWASAVAAGLVAEGSRGTSPVD